MKRKMTNHIAIKRPVRSPEYVEALKQAYKKDSKLAHKSSKEFLDTILHTQHEGLQSK